MSEDMMQPGDEKLARLLRAARPTRELRPGFQNNVWRRIERGHQEPAAILELLVGWLLRPRMAAAVLTVVMVLAAGVGAMRGIRTGEREARDRYVASVDPAYLHR